MSPLQPEEIRLLTEVGFLAGARGDIKHATAIFDALQACRPNAGFAYVGMAMAHLNRRQYDDALRRLDDGLKRAEEADAADLHAIRALVLHLAGRASECDRAIHAAGNHLLARALATQGALAA